MRRFNKVALVSLILVMPLSAVGAEKSTSEQPAKAAMTGNAAKAVRSLPDYKPPLRGAPAGRVGGGTRGTSERESFTLNVLAPDHVGNTVQEQPCLYWYLSKSTDYPLELTVIERMAVKPLLEQRLPVSERGRIQSACLSDYDVKLHKGTHYKWFVTLVVDPEVRSQDILAGGVLEVVDQGPDLEAKLQSADQMDAPGVYAQEGIWYDAIDSISKMIESSPDRVEYRKWRGSLLDQVGLAEVAAYDNKQIQ